MQWFKQLYGEINNNKPNINKWRNMGYLTEPLTLVFHFIFFTLYQRVFIIEYESKVKKIKSERYCHKVLYL